ncbi:MAG: HAMP domain-containing histidine kinase [Chitinispirillaceae bacterium]|nr:HAMP domain-containing histidine kinase [Chitinispirillaceae bacterium]
MRFQTKIFLLFALLFILAFGIRTVLTYQVQKIQRVEIGSDMKNISKIVHFATQRLASENDRDKGALTRFVTEAVRRYAELDEISIVNVEHEIVASSDSRKIGKKQADILSDPSLTASINDEDSVNRYEMTIPIVKNQQVIGQVLASIIINDVNEPFIQLLQRNTLITVMLFLSVAFVSWYMIRRLMQPMQALVAAARRVANGDFDTAVPVSGRNEYAELSNAFNVMAKKMAELRTYEERLRTMERHVILSETAAILAHEIRNPLNFINLTAGRLAGKFKPAEEHLHEEYLNLIDELRAQVRHLNRMVNDFLAIGRPLKLKITSFFLRELVDQIEMIIKQQLRAKEIVFSIDIREGFRCLADIEQMRLVLLNLLTNAIDISRMGGRIFIEGACEKETAVIRIRDTGPGIDPEIHGKIFEPYVSMRSGGTGLGLTLARRVVEEHGGTIRAENHPEGGAVFIIMLPGSTSEKTVDSR